MAPRSIDTRPGRPILQISLALIAITVGVGLAISAGGARASANVSLSFKQSPKSAHFKADGLEALAAGGGASKLCWVIESRADRKVRQWCAERSTGGTSWKLTGKRKGAKLRVQAASALLALDPALAGLDPGLYRWHFEVASCTAPTPQTGATGEAGLTKDDCSARHPKSGGKSVRIRGLLPASCKVKGAAQVNRGPRRAKRIALTFDDGPAPLTPNFLAKLRSLKVEATFFVIGQQVAGKRALLKRMLREGHELANHSWNHANLGGGGGGASRQLADTNRAISRATGFRPCVMRPPYGATSRDLVRRVRAQRMTSILWDVDPLDWRTPGAQSIASTIVRQARAGSIILEHDGGGPRAQTLAAIPQYVRTLKARGYKFVTVSELLGYETKYRLDK